MRQSSKGQMFLTCFYTDNFEPILIRFLSGIEDDVHLDCYNLEAEGVAGLGGGNKVWKFKTDLLIKSSDPTSRHEEDIVVFTDIDISVYKSFKEEISKCLDNADILFQSEYGLHEKNVNIGVIAFRRSAKITQFWKDVMEIVTNTGEWDQKVVNNLINDSEYMNRMNIKCAQLPDKFWARTVVNLPVYDCILHHANNATTQSAKWIQLNTFRSIFETRSYIQDYAFGLVRRFLKTRVWNFGELSQKNIFGQIMFDENLFVKNYNNHNEFRLVVGKNSLTMLTRSNDVSCIFNEFYFDRFRNRIMCVGEEFPEQYSRSDKEKKFHYLIASGFAE